MSVVGQHVAAAAESTEDLGARLAAELAGGDAVLLAGDLGAGKTTLVRGLLHGLGGDPEEVSSPTFVLLQTYLCQAPGIRLLHHVDLYRLEDRLGQLREIGLEEVLQEQEAVVAIEWPRHSLDTWLPPDARCWRVELRQASDGSRRIRITRDP